MSKKDIPFELAEAIEPIYAASTNLISYNKDEICYYNFIDKDENSKFFFKIYNRTDKRFSQVKTGEYVVVRKPYSKKIHGSSSYSGTVENIVSEFREWISLIKEYNDLSSMYDEPFEKKYSQYFYEEFTILDDDADTSPFNPKQQEYIEEYLSELAENLVTSESESEEKVQLIIKEIESLKSALPFSTKNEVMRKISKIWAKTYVNAKKVAQWFFNKMKEELPKAILKEIIGHLTTKYIGN
jgi:hypothetical protein